MTLFAVACAGIFPLIHTGRPWMAYYMFPYPSTMGLWPQFRSPLVWDVFAVGTYFTVSLIFWYIGLVPDLATLRDRSQSRVGRVIYGMLALGWRGSAMHWHRYETAYLLLAGIATPLAFEHDPKITRWIVKPDDGAGATSTRLHGSLEAALEDWSQRSRSDGPMAIEPWVEGQAMSLSMAGISSVRDASSQAPAHGDR